MRFNVLKMPVFLGFAGILAAGAAQAEPSALVEDITSDRDDVQLMDYLEPGQTIKLAADETIVIGYLLSCIQETITGGTVTVGEDESTVAGGKVESGYVDCDGGPVVAQVGAEQEAGAGAFRGNVPPPDRIIYGLSPIVRLSEPANDLRLKLMNSDEEEVTVPVNGKVVDFADLGIVLQSSGTYLLTAGERRLLFKVSALSEPNPSKLARFLPF